MVTVVGEFGAGVRKRGVLTQRVFGDQILQGNLNWLNSYWIHMFYSWLFMLFLFRRHQIKLGFQVGFQTRGKFHNFGGSIYPENQTRGGLFVYSKEHLLYIHFVPSRLVVSNICFMLFSPLFVDVSSDRWLNQPDPSKKSKIRPRCLLFGCFGGTRSEFPILT